MGFFDEVGKKAGQFGNWAGDQFSTLSGAVMGGSDSPGLLGTGQYRPGEVYTPDRNASQIAGYGDTRNRMLAGAAGAQGRQSAQTQAAQINMAPQGQFRDQQTALANALMAQSRGEGPSLAQMQLQRATDTNLANALAMAASQRGSQSLGAGRNAAMQRAAMQQQAAADSGMLRLQEQQAAQNMLGQVLSGARGQDIGLAQGQAGLDQQTNLANLQADMQQRGMNDAMTQFYTGQGNQMDLAQAGLNVDLQKLLTQRSMGQEGLGLQAYEGAGQRRQDMFKTGSNILGGLGQGAATLLPLLASDERVKEDIKPASRDMYSFLDSLSGSKYRYKDASVEGTRPGTRYSVMAQELEKTPVGKTMVVDGEDGVKRVDYGGGLAAMLASQAELHKRLKRLERLKRGSK